MTLKNAVDIGDVTNEDIIDLRNLAAWLRDLADPELNDTEDEDWAETVAEAVKAVGEMVAQIGYQGPNLQSWEWLADTLQELGDNTGSALIKGTYWVRYVKEYADGQGNLDDSESRWPFNHIDWPAAADELATDYDDVTLDGIDYKIRSS